MFAPPSIAMPNVLALFATRTRAEVGSNIPGCKAHYERDYMREDERDRDSEMGQ